MTLFGFGKLCSPKAWGFASPLLFYPFSLKKNSLGIQFVVIICSIPLDFLYKLGGYTYLDIQILVCYSIIEVALNENQEIEET